MRIVIVGAGLGGLAAAHCFARKGHSVVLLERQRELSHRGGGISVRPGATQVMIAWGLREDFEAVSDDYATTYFRDLGTGSIINSTIAMEVSDFPDWGTERELAHQILYRNAVQSGAEIKMNCQVDDMHEDVSGVKAVLKDGSIVSGDIALIADGVRSRLRSKVLRGVPGTVEPTPSDITLYSFKIPLAEARRDPTLAKHCEDTNLNVSFGGGRFVVFRANEKLQNFEALFGVQGVTDQKSLWDEDGDIEHVRNVFSDTDPALLAALRMTESCDRWRLAEMPDLPRWSSKGCRILLLGDSAHAMYPNAAQGFSLIIEDIAALEYLLELRKPIAFVASIWEQVRKPRVDRVKRYAFDNTQLFLGAVPRPANVKDGSRVKSSNSTVKSLKHVVGDPSAPFNTASFYKWCYDHDAVKAVQDYLDRVPGTKL